jgi:hypothetical protein
MGVFNNIDFVCSHRYNVYFIGVDFQKKIIKHNKDNNDSIEVSYTCKTCDRGGGCETTKAITSFTYPDLQFQHTESVLEQ